MISGNGLKGYNDYYACFNNIKEKNDYLKNEINPKFYFRAKDHIDFSTNKSNNMGVSQHDREELTICTPAMFDFQNDDIIMDMKSKDYWRVSKIIVADDGEMKKYSLHPRKITYLTLVR